MISWRSKTNFNFFNLNDSLKINYNQGRDAFSENELNRGKIIAKARIHVERFNERLKNYEILQGIIPHYYAALMDQIVFVLCCLTNFQPPLVE